MSGDVQPRKRKDKKKKKDELGLEEPRGTAAALGEGDVFMHSYSDHGTGGHWCAKIIFFSLLAILVTLIGLIILENRGLSDLEANAVESQYSNILEGWIEDAPDDDHHDEHTLELKHHDDDEDDHYDSHDVGDHDEEHDDEDDEEQADEDDEELADEDDEEQADEDDEELADEDDKEHADDEEHVYYNEDEQDEDEHTDEDEQADDDKEIQEDDDEQNNDEDSQQDLEDADEDEDDRSPYKYYSQENEEEEDETIKDDDDKDEQNNAQDDDDEQDDAEDHDEQNESNEEIDNDDVTQNRDGEGDADEATNENDEDDEDADEHEDHDHEDEDDELEVEKIEREASEEEPMSIGLPALPEEDDDDDDKDKDDDHDDDDDDDDDADDEADADDDFLEADAPPVLERVTAPAGKPFKEVDEDDDSTEKPPDTLEEEEEYEKRQEEKRKEEEESSHHIWLKLSVGAALLVATHAVLRRATAHTAHTAPRDEAAEGSVEREETPVVVRRMTLIPSQAAPPVIPKKEIGKPVVEDIVRREAAFVKAPPVVIKQDSEEEEVDSELEEVVEEEEIEEDEPEKLGDPHKKFEKDNELYSDEEVEEEEEEEVIIPKKETPKAAVAAPKVAAPAPKPAEPAKPEPEEEEEDPDDVEIIDDELLEEEEEEVSDIDDSELLSRLEAKYGRLPEPERPGPRNKDGGNSVEEMWAGEPADAYWRQQLDSAERDLRQGAWSAAAERASAEELRLSARARYVTAAALDRLAEARRDNGLLTRAIAAYFNLLEMSERLPDKKLIEIARRTLDRIQFRGNYLKAEPVYRILIRRFPDETAYRNNLTVSFLMAGRNDLAENTLKETLARWPNDRVALVHYAFILKTGHKDRLEEAVALFQKALEGDKGPACEPRFYYHYGDALSLLGRFAEAHEVHKRGAELGHFLSAAQRSLYNVPRLKSRPWWDVNETPYAALAKNLERRWKEILQEGQKAAALFEKEKEGLKERGEWSQMDLFVRGQEIPGRCAVAPVTCAVVKGESAAAGCRRGQVKFSSMAPGTHVRPHVGPTNCRLRMHLALSNTKGTFLRVDQETRQWQEGKVLLFDDSFEHEVWHNGTAERLVLIVDVWHPGLTLAERRTLPPI